ncbi:MAG: hypothetical protein ACO1OB_27755 [Archangium sp.]
MKTQHIECFNRTEVATPLQRQLEPMLVRLNAGTVSAGQITPAPTEPRDLAT